MEKLHWQGSPYGALYLHRPFFGRADDLAGFHSHLLRKPGVSAKVFS